MTETQYAALDEVFDAVFDHRGSEEFTDKLEEAVVAAAKKHGLDADVLIVMANRRLFRATGVI